MQCFGWTKLFRRCKNQCNNLFCHKHRFQPLKGLIGLATIIVTFYSIHQIFFQDKPATKEDVLTMQDIFEKKFQEFAVPDINSNESYPGFNVIIVLKIIQQTENRRKYIFDIGESKTQNRASIFLDANNIMIFEVIDNSGEIYNVKISHNKFEFNEFISLFCEYGVKDDFSFLRIFIDNSLVEQTKYKFQVDFQKKYQTSTFMADIAGENLSHTTTSFAALGKSTFGKNERDVIHRAIERYLSHFN
jgi:hypothetical protein